MAAASTPNLVYPPTSPRSSSPTLKGFKKVFSSRRRSSDLPGEDAPHGRTSVDSTTLDRSTTIHSTRSSPDRERASKSGHHGSVAKLIPGHNKRVRERQRESEIQAFTQDYVLRGRSPKSAVPSPPGTVAQNRSQSSLLTDGSENDTPPPLVSRDSHTGYFTTSSPLIASKTVDDGLNHTISNVDLPSAPSVEAFPIILEPHQSIEGNVSPRSPKLNFDSAPVLPSPTLMDRADTLGVEHTPGRRGSISKLRAKSPARKIRNVFSRSAKSPGTSPERMTLSTTSTNVSANSSQASIAERRLVDNPDKSIPAPLKSPSAAPAADSGSPRRPLALETELAVPRTPPSGRLTTPLTTVTPPTPTDVFRGGIVASPKMVEESDHHDGNDTESSNEASGNALGHRRVRSASSAAHQKSKLSTSMTVPLTPTIEDHNKSPVDKLMGGRNFTGNSGFFSSWVSAAQNAATSITNLTAQNRSRAGTNLSEPAKTKTGEETETTEVEAGDKEKTKRQLAVETLGSGNLDFSQLGLDATVNDKASLSSRPDLSSLRKKSDLQRDEAHAKVEDVLAKRAVSAAYEDGGESTPVAEISDPVGSIRHATNLDNTASGTLTPPNGSIFEGEQGVKRSNSVRSKLANRRSRGSSIATGQSVVATTSGTSATTLVNPPATPRMAGFTPAPKQRNRAFHQQFRSVPEDDNLIEDYSCALQKEILLAGRIYISEGHICFSSNILGWVTTLIISFEEIVSIEREHTAMIIPNAIAIQTLHARHTFRSLLSREATFDLMIGIWKVNHPTSFSKSVNGKQLVAEQAQRTAEKALGTKAADEGESEGSSDEDSGSDEDDGDDESAPSIMGSSASVTGSDVADAKTVTRKPSGTTVVPPTTNGSAPPGTSNDVVATATVVAGVPGAAVDFPGPAVHSPTECTDGATHYDKIIKDEVIAAPLGKIYSLLYGPQSGAFLRKYLADECKCLDLALDDDKKGLNNDNKSRQYSYIKPLGGSIGPKQTKCITTENLDFFDLEKSLSVTCTTQTPDVPSGGSFSTKTRYCLTWAPGNATRLQMNCTIEWTAKSWLKGPIEKGANDGQQQYGDGLIKAIKAALGRSRGATVSSKGAKGKKKKKGERRNKSEQQESTTRSKNWGLFEPLRPTLEPAVDIVGPVMKMEVLVGILTIMMFVLWFGGSRGSNRQVGRAGSPLNHMERLAAYEHLWQREESDLWDWLEDRAGVDRVILGGSAGSTNGGSGRKGSTKNRARSLKDKSMAARLQGEKWSRKEMQEAVRVTRERLEEMQRALDEKIV